MILYKKILNANCGPATPEIISAALIASGLHWEMNLAQVASLESQALKHAETVKSQHILNELAPTKKHEVTLFGIPVKIVDDMPKEWIILAHENHHLFKIEALAYPVYLDLDTF